MSKIDELVALEQAATPGPWKVATNAEYEADPWWPLAFSIGGSEDGKGRVIMTDGQAGHDMAWAEHDADLLVALRNAVPDLLALVQRVREEMKSTDVCPLCDQWRASEGHLSDSTCPMAAFE